MCERARARLSHVLTHCSAPVQRSPTAAGHKSPDDVVLCSALRTAIGKARRGAFRNTKPDVLLRAVLKAVVDQTNVPYSVLGDINVGNVQMGGAYAAGARMAAFTAGFPETVPLSTVNRQCSSGLQAVANIANSILSGQIDAGIGAGVESMSLGGGVADANEAMVNSLDMNSIFENELARQSLSPMGITSENVAERYGITREEQDEMACHSHKKALRAQREGRFTEIVPVTTVVEDENGDEQEITVTRTTARALVRPQRSWPSCAQPSKKVGRRRRATRARSPTVLRPCCSCGAPKLWSLACPSSVCTAAFRSLASSQMKWASALRSQSPLSSRPRV